MTRTKLAAVVGIAGAVLLLAGCQDNDVRKYLAKDREMYKWGEKVQYAICQLEENNPMGLDPNKRICPDGSTGITPPPSYPPEP